jgi:hypothetical protein
VYFSVFLAEIDNIYSIDNMKISAGQKCMRREGVFCESYLEVVCMTVYIPVTNLRKVKWFVICPENNLARALSHFGGAFQTSAENLTAVTEDLLGFSWSFG